MAETLREARWRKQAPPQATLAFWPHTHPTAGARVKAEEPQATPGHELLEGAQNSSPQLRTWPEVPSSQDVDKQRSQLC